MKINVIFFLLLGITFIACDSGTNEVTEALGETEIMLEDTLQLEQGRIPEKWQRIELQRGYYIGFPKKPRKKEKNDRAEWKLVRDQYELYVSITNLEKEASFEENKQYRMAYYHAIINDLADGIDGEPSDTAPFLCLDTYEGMQTTILSDDAQLFVRTVIIGKDLLTICMVLYEEDKPVYFQLREKFYASLGKDIYILEQ